MNKSIKSKPKSATVKENPTDVVNRFMQTPVIEYLKQHPTIKTFDDLLKTVAIEAEKAINETPERYLTQEQIKSIKGETL